MSEWPPEEGDFCLCAGEARKGYENGLTGAAGFSPLALPQVCGATILAGKAKLPVTGVAVGRRIAADLC